MAEAQQLRQELRQHMTELGAHLRKGQVLITIRHTETPESIKERGKRYLAYGSSEFQVSEGEVFSGQNDAWLLYLGLLKAGATGGELIRMLDHLQAGAIHMASSPQPRAVQTSGAIRAVVHDRRPGLQVTYVELEGLKERSNGDHTGRLVADLMADPGLWREVERAWHDVEHPFPGGGESFLAVAVRVMRDVIKAIRAAGGKPCVIVAHYVAIAVLRQLLQTGELNGDVHAFGPEHGEMNVLQFDGTSWWPFSGFP